MSCSCCFGKSMNAEQSRWVAVALLVFLLGIATLLPFSCTANAGNYNGFSVIPSDIPITEIIHGGPGRDGIPAIDEPTFTAVGEERAIRPSDLVVGVVIDNEAKAYPLNILNWHEIVNDSIAGIPIAVTYCPLCRSGIVFNATIEHRSFTEEKQVLSFGVSGLLYNNNLLFYDRETESLWSQVNGRAVTGKLIGTKLLYIPSVITSWSKWSSEYPDTVVMVPGEGMNRDYFTNPYADYEKTEKIIFPVNKKIDDTLPNKELVAGVVLPNHEGNKAYPFSLLEKMNERGESSFIDSINGIPVTVVWDDEGKEARVYDFQGATLPTITMYWFSWNLFYPDSEVYKLPR